LLTKHSKLKEPPLAGPRTRVEPANGSRPQMTRLFRDDTGGINRMTKTTDDAGLDEVQTDMDS